MKKHLLKYLFAMFILFGITATTHAQTRVYVKVRPTAVIKERPVAPHPGYVWVGDEWTVKNDTYIHVDGYWAAPREGYIWKPGHWTSEAKGDYWVPGHWKRI